MKYAALVLPAFVAIATPAEASTVIRYDVSGDVNGNAFSGYFEADASADTSANPFYGEYAITAFNFLINGTSFAGTSGTIGVNPTAPHTNFFLSNFNLFTDYDLTVVGLERISISGGLRADLASDALPTSFANFANNRQTFDFAVYSASNQYLSGFSGSYIPQSGVTPVYSSITAAVSAVPEPASWSMMILGFGLLGAALRGASWRRIAVSRSVAKNRVHVV